MLNGAQIFTCYLVNGSLATDSLQCEFVPGHNIVERDNTSFGIGAKTQLRQSLTTCDYERI